ncbi:MAG: cysteine desulfurase [Candidatus Cloacimonetes bacterium]|nr:cysteine desulfurase [Candidatus Cloacimonadota bacterium]
MYFDYNATHPICNEVVDTITDILNVSGNPSSAHKHGRFAKDRIEEAREIIADYLGISYKELIFTSGGTESNVLGLLGYCSLNLEADDKVLYSGLEHPSLLGVIHQLKSQGLNCVKVNCNTSGSIDMDDFKSKLVDAKLVTIMYVNNETGIQNPVGEIGKLCAKNKVIFHCDCVQALSKTAIDLSNIDLASFSGHKIGGLKGVGFLFKKSHIKLSPLFPKSTQEKGHRGGTENVTGILSMASAIKSDAKLDYVRDLRDYFENQLSERIECVQISGKSETRVGNTSNVYFPDCSGESLIFSLDMKGICVSLGSACAAGSISPSHVLLEMGFSESRAKSTVRFSFGKYNTKEEVDFLLDNLDQIINRIKK